MVIAVPETLTERGEEPEAARLVIVIELPAVPPVTAVKTTPAVVAPEVKVASVGNTAPAAAMIAAVEIFGAPGNNDVELIIVVAVVVVNNGTGTRLFK